MIEIDLDMDLLINGLLQQHEPDMATVLRVKHSVYTSITPTLLTPAEYAETATEQVRRIFSKAFACLDRQKLLIIDN